MNQSMLQQCLSGDTASKKARPIFNMGTRRFWLQKNKKPLNISIRISSNCLRLNQSKRSSPIMAYPTSAAQAKKLCLESS